MVIDNNVSAEKLQRFMRIKDMHDVPSYINTCIYSTYRTTAVTAIDVLSYACNDSRLRLDLYQQPLWAVAMQIDEDVVRDAVDKCLYNWEMNGYADNFVNTFLLQKGVTSENLKSEREKLLLQLPVVLREERSPDVYKLYRAVEIMSQKESNSNDAVFKNSDYSSTYIAGMLNYEEENVPIKLATAMASDDVAVSKSSGGLTGVVGAAMGTAVKLKYSLADSYDSAMRNSMGDYADRYDEDKQISKEKREQVRAMRLEEQHAYRETLREEKRLDRQSARDNERIRTLNEAQAAKGWVDTPVRQSSQTVSTFDGNMSPNIPTWLIALGANALLLLIIALIVGWGRAVLPGAGLVIATVGFLKQKANEPNYMQTIIAGYAVAAIAVILM